MSWPAFLNHYDVNYYQTYVERDVRQLIQLKDVSLFEKMLKLMAGRTGQVFDYSLLAKHFCKYELIAMAAKWLTVPKPLLKNGPAPSTASSGSRSKRWAHVQEKLAAEAWLAEQWRDIMCRYLLEVSGIPDAKGRFTEGTPDSPHVRVNTGFWRGVEDYRARVQRERERIRAITDE